jgi:hypothetical protein
VTYGFEIGAIRNATFLTEEEKEGIFEGNSRAIFE